MNGKTSKATPKTARPEPPFFGGVSKGARWEKIAQHITVTAMLKRGAPPGIPAGAARDPHAPFARGESTARQEPVAAAQIQASWAPPENPKLVGLRIERQETDLQRIGHT